MVIEGRTFVQESPSFEQDLYIMEQVTEAGLVQLGGLKLDDSQNLPHMAQQMLLQAYKSGALFRLIGALMVEEGTEWSPEQAAINAEFFRKVRDPDSKRHLQTAMVGAVVAFFENAGSSDLTSLISLESPSGRPTVENGAPKQPRPPKLTEEQAGALFRSGIMPTSSAKSPTTTELTRKTSSGRGKSVKG
jgi:hypothetical protein